MDWGEFGKNIIGKKMIVLLLVTGAVYFSAISDTSVSTGTVGHAVCHDFGPMMKRMNQRLHFSQTPQCHSASHRGNSVVGGVTLGFWCPGC